MSVSRTGAFTDNMKLPVHRWFRYSAGFSAEWVERLVRQHRHRDPLLLDPFTGSGTSLLAAQAVGMPSAGAERHPFVTRVAAAKLAWTTDPRIFGKRGAALLARAQRGGGSTDAPPLLERCYTAPALADLDALRYAFLGEAADDPFTPLLWLAITAILRECSGVGTAQWQYLLPDRTKARVVRPFDAFERRIAMFVADMQTRMQTVPNAPAARLELDDARRLDRFADLTGQVTLVATSPPYPNNYDYADAARLEMTFWREIAGWGELQAKVRHGLVRSCSQHSAAEKLSLDPLLAHEAIAPIRSDLTAVCEELAIVRRTHGGKKTYHTMIAAYFIDLAMTWRALRRLCAPGADLCFVIGDSAPYGVHVPVEQWLARLGEANGFGFVRFDKVRDRNLKWKNRKHRVPLHEGNLWMKG